MPVVIAERVKSRRSQIAVDSAGGSIDVNYFVLGTGDDLAVRSLVESVIPAQYGGMYFHTYSIEPLGALMWDVVVKYFSTLPKSATSPVFQFDTSGGTHHITVSRETVRSYSFTDEQEPDYQGAIGVNGDSVEGCDVTIPQFTFSVVRYLPQGAVTRAFRNALFHLTARTNAEEWNGFEPGTVLFQGAQGSVRGLDFWEITFKFAAAPNRDADDPITIGRTDLQVAKGGWEYLWVRYADKVDGAARALVRVPVSAYIERVYDAGDFSVLGIVLPA
jgi:hypothetical protein